VFRHENERVCFEISVTAGPQKLDSNTVEHLEASVNQVKSVEMEMMSS
jgi:hypothetical protein